MIMIIVAAVATMFATGAIVMGQRNQIKEHPLKGSVARRKGIFQQFADCALCDSVPLAQNDATAGQRHLEMTMSKDDYDNRNYV